MSGRKPRVIINLTEIEKNSHDPFIVDIFEDLDNLVSNTQEPIKTIFGWGKLIVFSITSLFVLGFGLWTDNLIRGLFSQYTVLGWVGLFVAAIGIIGLCAFLINEVRAIIRLASVDHLRNAATTALATDDITIARNAVSELMTFTKAMPYASVGRRVMKSHEGDIIDGHSLIHLAEYHILQPADIEARRVILNAAKRVSVVTAVSPRAIIDLGYVLFESIKLIRSLASIYGCRPGKFGFISIIKRVAAHLAVTGSIAVGDGLLHQIIGQGLAARLSAKMGEGVVNGLMTTRIGIAAMDALRPFPFNGQKRPNISDFTSDLFSSAPKNNEKMKKSQ